MIDTGMEVGRCIGADTHAGVYLLDVPYCIDRMYDYYIPHGMERVTKGTFVTVPFGRGNRKQMAVVVDVHEAEEVSAKAHEIKPIGGVCADSFRLTDQQLAMCFFLKEQTLCTLGEAVRTVVPTSALAHLVEYYRPTDIAKAEGTQGIDQAGLFIYQHICARGCVSAQSLRARFGASAEASLATLVGKGLVDKELNLHQSQGTPMMRYYSLFCDADVAMRLSDGEKVNGIRLTSELQKKALRVLAENSDSMSEPDLKDASGAGRTQMQGLESKGLIVCREEPAWRAPDMGTDAAAPVQYMLNDEQAAAVDTICDLADREEPQAVLLYGVTGSGKTCVMLHAIDHVLDTGHGVIVLLPEISLTPQMLAQFSARYGERIAVIHSGLSAGERFDSYERIRRGDATVVIGTRSAVFAPVRDLGLIIMDEEQEHTYKSDMNPKYHARDIARYRCATENALLLLASATPSLESFHKAKEGKYHLLRLTGRYGAATLPRVEVADMRKEPAQGNTTPLGNHLCEELARTVGEGNQAVLFLNRRGYSTQVVCRSCGHAVTCPTCSVAMNYHTRRGTYESGDMVCHWCGRRRPYPTKCPDCDSPHLMRMGYGTQRVEQDVQGVLPDARILRMDADTTSTKSSYADILGRFRRHEADILLGTQMVTKGHDFADVTLVGVLMADSSLYLDDYRASEKTFSMLTQVIGRAGRADKEGVAVIQTMNPDNDVMKLAFSQDYDTFYEREIKIRKLLTFPPFCDMVLLTLTSPDEKELQKGALRLSEELIRLTKTEYEDVPLITFGPFEAPVYRVDNTYRMRMVVKCRLNRRSRELFSHILTEFGATYGANKPVLSVDMNPSSL